MCRWFVDRGAYWKIYLGRCHLVKDNDNEEEDEDNEEEDEDEDKLARRAHWRIYLGRCHLVLLFGPDLHPVLSK